LLVALIILGRHRIYQMSERAFSCLVLCSLAGSRLALFVALFVIAKVSPTSDVTMYYRYGNAVMAGMVPNRDFQCEYGFWFPYVLSMLLRIWNSPKSIILFAIVVDIAALRVWMIVGQRLFAKEIVRTAAVLYICSPVPLVNVALDGQQQVWIALMIGLAMLALTDDRAVTGGVILTLCVELTKFLSLLFAPALAACTRYRAAFGLTSMLSLVALAGLLRTRGVEVLQPVLMKHDDFSSGNLP